MKSAPFLATLAAVAALASAAQARPVVLVELFTAQGCSSCGPANAYVAGLADQKDVVALTWAVDYWDYLGWKDTFAKPEFADRQRLYARELGVREVYTPQVVVDGRAEAPGVKSDAVDRLIRQERRTLADPPDMRLERNGRVGVGSGHRPKGAAEVWLIRYDPRAQDVEIKAGDNRGETVSERNVVVQLQRLGAWKGRPVSFKLPAAPQDGLATVVVLQYAGAGRVIGVLQEPKS
ncbi:MAG: DUF1223 domain-containing protein [Caulobacterales bacterium]